MFKAPAGTEAGVSGAIAVATTVSDAEQDQLNPIKVNVIRTVPGSGIVVWGTRTIGSDAEWRYIPVRRVAIFLRTSIYYGIQWAVFEPNDVGLWAESPAEYSLLHVDAVPCRRVSGEQARRCVFREGR